MESVYQDKYDHFLRSAAFAFLDSLSALRSGPVRFEDLVLFRFGDERIPLMDLQRGIRKPKQLDAALSIRTVHARSPQDRPYVDDVGSDGYLRYSGGAPTLNRARTGPFERRVNVGFL